MNLKKASITAVALLILLSSCANGILPVPGTEPSDTAADPPKTDVTTSAADPPESTVITPATGDSASDIGSTSPENIGTQTSEKKLWDPSARAAAIERVVSKLPEHLAGEEFELMINDGLGTVLASGNRYLTRTVRYKRTSSSGGTLKSVEKEACVTIVQNSGDGSLWIVVSYSNGKGALAVTITPDENYLRKITDKYGSSLISNQHIYREVKSEVLRECLLFDGYQADPFRIIIAEVSNILSKLNPDISLETFGVYDDLPEETNAIPGGADFLFGDERYRVELMKNDDGSLKTLRLSSEKGDPFDFSLHDGSVDLFVFAYRDTGGGIRVVAFYERLYTPSSGTPTLRMVYTGYDCTDGSLIPVVSGDRSVDGLIYRRSDDIFFDSGHIFYNCRERSERALTEARGKAADCLIVFDYYSGRDESSNRYMIPGEIPENFDWKIANSIDLR